MPIPAGPGTYTGVTLTQAKLELNLDDDDVDDGELLFYINAANEWMSQVVTTLTPYPVQLATVELIEHWWESQRGPAQGPLSEDVEAGGLRGYGIPYRVRDKIQPWLKPIVSSQPLGSFPDPTCWPDPASRYRW